MGGGSWSYDDFASYTCSTKGMSYHDYSTSSNLSTQKVFKARHISTALSPNRITRECCDSTEHPRTLPVILALDVTGSMGSASVRVAQKLNEIMTDLYADPDLPDIEFCIMGIGDIHYDDAPIQMSQFESDIRIAEQLDEIYFEGGGGGNSYESYTAAWYMGVKHCVLDCWKRGDKGIIITMGDELPNPTLNARELMNETGDSLQANIDTKVLLTETREKFDVYHISIDDPSSSYEWHNDHNELDNAWGQLLGESNYKVANLDNLASTITGIIKNHSSGNSFTINSSFIGDNSLNDDVISW